MSDVEKILVEKILEVLGEMGRRMDAMQEDMSALKAASSTKEDIAALKSEMATKKDLQQVRSEMTTKEDLQQVRSEMATKEDLQQAKGEMMVLMEAYFEPKFDLMAEQIKLIQEKQIPIEAMDRVEDRLDVAEAAIKSCFREIRNLKKAQ